MVLGDLLRQQPQGAPSVDCKTGEPLRVVQHGSPGVGVGLA